MHDKIHLEMIDDFLTKWQQFALSSALCRLSLFHNFEIWQGALKWSLKNQGFICNTIFFTCMHMHKSLSNKTWLLKIADLEIWLVRMETRQTGSLSSIVDSVFEKSLVNNFSVNTAYIYWGSLAVRRDLLLCDGWQTSSQACKKVT